MSGEYKYDVAISFAKGQRDYARAVQQALFVRGIHCFFDEVQQVQLWGQDLAERFDEVFRKDAQFCVACVSEEWVNRVWPAHERRSALARAVQEPGYLLPVRFDDSEVPGLNSSIAYLDGTEIEPEEMATLIARKLAGRHRSAYLPPFPNRLFAALEIAPEDEEAEELALRRAVAFLDDLKELTFDEQQLVISVIRFGCPCSLPENAHISVDRLKRLSGWELDQIRETSKSLRKVANFSVGLLSTEDEDQPVLAIGWEPMGVTEPHGKATDVADAMIAEAHFGTCEHCYQAALDRLDFSRTSSMLDWSSDESEQFDASDAPSSLRDLVNVLLGENWTMEVTPYQLRFLRPGSNRFDAVPLPDRYDQECLGLAREILEELVDEQAKIKAMHPEGQAPTARN
ncbi:MAG: TIR domain-containing protein [Solirubrobacterales bacterium]